MHRKWRRKYTDFKSLKVTRRYISDLTGTRPEHTDLSTSVSHKAGSTKHVALREATKDAKITSSSGCIKCTSETTFRHKFKSVNGRKRWEQGTTNNLFNKIQRPLPYAYTKGISKDQQMTFMVDTQGKPIKLDDQRELCSSNHDFMFSSPFEQ